MTKPSSSPARRRSVWKRVFAIASATLAVLLIALGITSIYLWRHVQPFLRARLVDTLANRLHAHVDLDQFQSSASLRHGFAVTGGGLRITPHGLEAYPPVIQVDHFAFHMDIAQLFNAQRHVRTVEVDGLNLMLPPKAQRKDMFHGAVDQPEPPPADTSKHTTHLALYFDQVLATHSTLTLQTDKPNHPPLVFDISSLSLVSRWGTGKLHYIADLRNPKPTGDIHAEGDFGPWVAEQPRSTNITGDYAFNHADLATTKGITGILNSTGHFSGPLEHLTVDGRADVPDFSVEEARHKVALFTTYHAIVDGTNGDTYLQPVEAHFRNTWFTCAGKVVRAPEGGHDIQLQVKMPRGRMEDLLWLAVKTPTPIIAGNVVMNTAFQLPPDPSHSLTVMRRLGLTGKITIAQMHFTNPETDRKLDSISLRTQGDVKQAQQLSKGAGPDDVSLDGHLTGDFTLAHGTLLLSAAKFQLPGLQADLHGSYNLPGESFDFTGDVRLEATVSQMFTGWKSLLLKPADRLFKKNGAGTFLPFHLSGTKDSPEIGIEVAGHTLEVHPKHRD